MWQKLRMQMFYIVSLRLLVDWLHTLIYTHPPTIRSWWSQQWVVVAACHCCLWWWWWWSDHTLWARLLIRLQLCNLWNYCCCGDFLCNLIDICLLLCESFRWAKCCSLEEERLAHSTSISMVDWVPSQKLQSWMDFAPWNHQHQRRSSVQTLWWNDNSRSQLRGRYCEIISVHTLYKQICLWWAHALGKEWWFFHYSWSGTKLITHDIVSLLLEFTPQKKTNFICSNWIFASMKFVVCGERTQNFHNPVQFDPNWSKVTIWSPLSGHWLWLRQHGCGWPVGQWLITAKALIGVKTSLKESHRQLETMQTNGDNWHPWSGP